MMMMRKVKKMSRLIDADALWMDIIHSMDVCDDILEIIERQPTIEPERKPGKWINEHMDYGECSECGFYGMTTDFCPNCGADMRGGQ